MGVRFVSQKTDIVEKFALVWRLIGQPEIEKFVVVVNESSELYDYFPDQILGMPVYFMCGKNMQSEVDIVMAGEYNDICEQFRIEWERQE
jgi:hypothetical protein